MTMTIFFYITCLCFGLVVCFGLVAILKGISKSILRKKRIDMFMKNWEDRDFTFRILKVFIETTYPIEHKKMCRLFAEINERISELERKQELSTLLEK